MYFKIIEHILYSVAITRDEEKIKNLLKVRTYDISIYRGLVSHNCPSLGEPVWGGGGLIHSPTYVEGKIFYTYILLQYLKFCIFNMDGLTIYQDFGGKNTCWLHI